MFVPASYDTGFASDGATDTATAADAGDGGSSTTQQDSAPVDVTTDAVEPDIVGPDASKKDTLAADSSVFDAGPSSPTSCAAKCGAKYDKSLICQCNSDCAKFGNCCADYTPICAPELLSCKGRCAVAYDKNLPCQCAPTCAKDGSCCGDWLGQCQAGVDLDFIHAGPNECATAADWVAVKYTKDGDTLELANGDIVRFLVVNTPELSTDDCYATDARSFTAARIKKSGYKACLVKDPNQPAVDVYGRLLRYVYYQEVGQLTAVQLNARLVRLGYGHVFYPYATGNVHEPVSLAMQQQARISKVGGWTACPGWN